MVNRKREERERKRDERGKKRERSERGKKKVVEGIREERSE